MRRHRSILGLLALLGGVLAACGDDDTATADGGSPPDATGDDTASSCLADPGLEPVDLDVPIDPDGDRVLLTHDSFTLSEGTLEAFTDETGVEVTVQQSGDAGALVAESLLTVGDPLGDVLFGIDNTFLCRGVLGGLFEPHESDQLDRVDPELVLDPHHRVTPVDFGDVCVNYWSDQLDGAPPSDFDDLTDERFAGEFVTPSPETSSPGFAFLLATIAAYGDDWPDYWRDLAANDVTVTSGWSEAYHGEFVAGGGDRALVTSYASSPPAEVVFADPPVDSPPTGVALDTCFRQVEFAGVLAGTDHPREAAALIDFLLSPSVQADIPLTMFVYPAVTDVALPDVFVEFGTLAESPATLDPETIEANRNDWLDEWVELMRG